MMRTWRGVAAVGGLFVALALGYLANGPGSPLRMDTNSPQKSEPSVEPSRSVPESAGKGATNAPLPGPLSLANLQRQKEITDLSRAVEKQTQLVQSLNQQLSNEPAESLARKLDDLNEQIRAGQQNLQTMTQARGTAENQAFQGYADEDVLAEERSFEQAAEVAGFERKVQQQAAQVRLLAQREQALAALNFDTDQLREVRAQLPVEQQKLRQMQQDYQSLRMQAGVADSLRRQNDRWKQETDRQRIQSQYDAQVRTVQQQLNDLQKQASATQEQLSQARNQQDQLFARYQTEQGRLADLQDQLNSKMAQKT